MQLLQLQVKPTLKETCLLKISILAEANCFYYTIHLQLRDEMDQSRIYRTCRFIFTGTFPA